MKFSTEELLQGILAQDKRILGKAITLIESKKPEHRVLAEELLKKILPYRDWETDRKSTRLNSSHITRSRMPSSA